MKATILVDHPFLIPEGTKMNLTLTDPKVECGPVFFAGYRLLGKEVIRDSFDLFPRFKKPTKDGTMSNRNIDLFNGVLGHSDLARCEIEILEFPDSFEFIYPDCNRYDNLTCGAVAVCVAEMLDRANRKGVTAFLFKDYPEVDAPYATFETVDSVTGEVLNVHLPVKSLEFNDGGITVRSSDDRFTGNLDLEYGEYFNVAEALPKIYRAFIEALYPEGTR